MNNQEFLRNALAYEECPSNFEEHYALFCKYQTMAIDTLKAVAEVFEKNNITYALLFGSLLGAIRDNGQIPWDYDVDIGVPYFEKERMYKALDHDLPFQYYYCAPERDKHYRPSIVRIVPKGYPHQMIHVDVFFLVGIPEDTKEREVYCNQIRESVRARRYVAENLSEYPYSIRTKMHYTIRKMKYLIKYGKSATGDQSKLLSRYDMRITSKATHVSATCGKIVDDSIQYLKSTPYKTRDGVFFVPKDYTDYLEKRFGEWKRNPSIKNCIAEVEKHYKLFQWYEQKKQDKKI